MKRIFSISVIILVLSGICSLNAQTKKVVHKKKPVISLDSLHLKNITYRLEIGYNNPAQYGKNFSTTYFNGIKVGLTAEYPLKNNLSLLTGALYNLVYSDKLQKYPNITSVDYLTYGHFINVPVQIAYYYPFSNNLKVFGYAGPTLNIGLSQIQGTISTVSSIPTAYTNLYNSNLNRLDLQVGIGAGIQWKKYQLKGGYDYGLLNINRLTTGNLYQKGWYVSLSITL
jgi:hypothetical protein